MISQKNQATDSFFSLQVSKSTLSQRSGLW